MRTLIYLLFLWIGTTSVLQAQELNATVNILLPQQVMSPPELFANMKANITEFLNGRKWSRDNWNTTERIPCTFQITIEQQVDNRSFKGSLQVTSTRPVYRSDYTTSVLNINDRDFEFVYQENTMIQWSNDLHRDNLSSVLAFYANLILAMDYDTFQLEGGTDYYLICQTIINNAQNAAEPGWRSTEKGRQNRFWFVENILSQSFRPIRECQYNYHRKGLDKLTINQSEALENISNALQGLKDVHRIKPSSYNMQVFFYSKGDEIVNLFKPLPLDKKQPISELCKLVDPGNITKYERIVQ
ncbi:MAG: DUF4835 family protein [Flavobacteriales bacterium]